MHAYWTRDEGLSMSYWECFHAPKKPYPTCPQHIVWHHQHIFAFGETYPVPCHYPQMSSRVHLPETGRGGPLHHQTTAEPPTGLQTPLQQGYWKRAPPSGKEGQPARLRVGAQYVAGQALKSQQKTRQVTLQSLQYPLEYSLPKVIPISLQHARQIWQIPSGLCHKPCVFPI
jgi:hypothetical protein